MVTGGLQHLPSKSSVQRLLQATTFPSAGPCPSRRQACDLLRAAADGRAPANGRRAVAGPLQTVVSMYAELVGGGVTRWGRSP